MAVNSQNTFIPSTGLRDVAGNLVVSDQGLGNRYRSGAITQTLYSAAAAVLVEVVGSATKLVRVKRVVLFAQAATKFYAELTLGRATTVSGTGSANVCTIGALSKGDAAATAVVNNYAAAATMGTGFAAIDARWLNVAPPAAGMFVSPCVWDFGTRGFVLSGVADVLQIYNNTLTLGTATYGFGVEFTEE
jgi:hypothetical protein